MAAAILSEPPTHGDGRDHRIDVDERSAASGASLEMMGTRITD
ncbi:hypothetical protein [Haloterrigena sp. H1]|nr:hypothetical protein [Haloterrigena sp. H1]